LFIAFALFGLSLVSGCSHTPAARLATVNYGDFIGAAVNTHTWETDPTENEQTVIGKTFTGFALWFTHGSRIGGGGRQYDLRTLYYTRTTGANGAGTHWLSEEARFHLFCPDKSFAMSAGAEIGYVHEPEAEHADGFMLGSSFYFSGNNYNEFYTDGTPLLYSAVKGYFVLRSDFGALTPGDVTFTAGVRFGRERFPVFIEAQLSLAMVWGFGIGTEINIEEF